MEGKESVVSPLFLSYSHKDERWKHRIVTHLRILEEQRLIELWDDDRTEAGEDWFGNIQTAIERSRIAILLISPNFLTSRFVLDEEIPKLLLRRQNGGLQIFPVIVEPCDWKSVPWLRKMQIRPRNAQPLSQGRRHRAESDLAAIVAEIRQSLSRAGLQQIPPGSLLSTLDKISISRLPNTGRDLFGREVELDLLDKSWANQRCNIVTVVSWGGVGKTTLVNHWLWRLAEHQYRGAERVFGWSFYSQGSEDRIRAADEFIESAFRWLDEKVAADSTPWSRGEQLAHALQAKRTLLVLDGLEPVQFPPGGPQEGYVKDASLRAMLRQLAAFNSGLCVISSRLPVTDLLEFNGATSHCIELEHLPPKAGAQLLKATGVWAHEGSEFERASRELSGHCLALTLLGSYLTHAYGGDLRRRDTIGPLTGDIAHGAHAKRVLKAYETWFQDKLELSILHIVGLFDRPIRDAAVRAIRTAPPIAGLTDGLLKMSAATWGRLVTNLRRARLLLPVNRDDAETLDAHPLIREYFRDRLQEMQPDAWRRANNRLYEYFSAEAKDLPDNLIEMEPLFQAVEHGCRARRYKEVLKEVYERRIMRGDEFYNTKTLGAYGSDLTILACFFERKWTQLPAEIDDEDKAYLFNQAGVRLRALGRLGEATEPLRVSMDSYQSIEDWKRVAMVSGNLTEVQLTMGQLGSALDTAEEGVRAAKESGDLFLQMVSNAHVGNVLHQMGRISESAIAFDTAEALKIKRRPEYPLLYSIPGFYFCDLLMTQGRYVQVRRRLETFFEWRLSTSLLETALEHLIYGRSLLESPAGIENTELVQYHLEKAIDVLRQAGYQEYLVYGLLSRANYFHNFRAWDRAQKDIDEAFAIAHRAEMSLYAADCYLSYARLYHCLREDNKSHECLAMAQMMITRMGYHRRDGDVVAIQHSLQHNR